MLEKAGTGTSPAPHFFAQLQDVCDSIWSLDYFCCYSLLKYALEYFGMSDLPIINSGMRRKQGEWINNSTSLSWRSQGTLMKDMDDKCHAHKCKVTSTMVWDSVVAKILEHLVASGASPSDPGRASHGTQR
ncbi:uncharacterized protein LOC124653662 [Lolium rigidum]|uniref:uncharacterized protein LOC124653662 n=1 Tax=Lolium rigidum TaxID=89674 RepID=UPI001F5C172E|nr:uncharacterized protein LOC124653662 [Lolium rigidum]